MRKVRHEREFCLCAELCTDRGKTHAKPPSSQSRQKEMQEAPGDGFGPVPQRAQRFGVSRALQVGVTDFAISQDASFLRRLRRGGKDEQVCRQMALLDSKNRAHARATGRRHTLAYLLSGSQAWARFFGGSAPMWLW